MDFLIWKREEQQSSISNENWLIYLVFILRQNNIRNILFNNFVTPPLFEFAKTIGSLFWEVPPLQRNIFICMKVTICTHLWNRIYTTKASVRLCDSGGASIWQLCCESGYVGIFRVLLTAASRDAEYIVCITGVCFSFFSSRLLFISLALSADHWQHLFACMRVLLAEFSHCEETEADKIVRSKFVIVQDNRGGRTCDNKHNEHILSIR